MEAVIDRSVGEGGFRVFCAYGPHYREPGCGWEAFAESEGEARLLGERHARGQTHATDYESVREGMIPR